MTICKRFSRRLTSRPGFHQALRWNLENTQYTSTQEGGREGDVLWIVSIQRVSKLRILLGAIFAVFCRFWAVLERHKLLISGWHTCKQQITNWQSRSVNIGDPLHGLFMRKICAFNWYAELHVALWAPRIPKTVWLLTSYFSRYKLQNTMGTDILSVCSWITVSRAS